MTHQHPPVPFAGLLPPVPAQLPAGVDDTARAVLAAVWADCDDCVGRLWKTLEQTQRRETRRQPVDDNRTADLHVRSVTTDPAAPGALEAVHAYGLLAAATLIIDQARRAEADPVAHAEGFAAEYAVPPGHPFATSSAAALRAIASLVQQGADPEAAAELAQGVITTGDLMGIDGHALLAETARLTLIVALTVGLVTATEFDLTTPAAEAAAAPPARRGEPYWLLAVLGVHDEELPVLAVQPANQATYDALATRLRTGGWRKLSRREWTSGVWSIAPAGAVDVVDADLIRLTTGKASVYTSQHCQVTPRWMFAAQQKRARIALVPVGQFDHDEMTVDEGLARLEDLAAAGKLLGAMATVRFDMPIQRPGR